MKTSMYAIYLKELKQIFFFSNSVLRPFQDYFSSYEMGQSVGGAKTEEPREKTPGTSTSRTWFVSLVASAGLKPTPDTTVPTIVLQNHVTIIIKNEPYIIQKYMYSNEKYALFVNSKPILCENKRNGHTKYIPPI